MNPIGNSVLFQTSWRIQS